MRHDSTGGDNTLSGTQVLAQCPGPLNVVHQFDGVALDVKPKHAAMQSISVLPIRQFLLRMTCQSRINYLADLRMRFQECSNFHGRCRLLTDTQSHSFHSLEHQKGRHRRHDVSMHVLDEFNAFIKLRSFRYKSSTSSNVQSIIILGKGLDSEIAPMIEWAADIWSGKRRVAHVKNAMLLSNFRDGIQISQSQSWVGRTLTKDELCVGLDCRLHVFGIGKIDKAKFHPKRHELLATDAVSATVAAIGDNTMVSCIHEGIDA
mmetsp:Transcript_12388/g.20412  ORF Transcript_12388/g.20412 Transcript_12388/m.20412 type:complete len:261 (+) Transcript_12388:1452-2234(+)